MTSESKYEKARKIQDLFCKLEEIGHNFDIGTVTKKRSNKSNKIKTNLAQNKIDVSIVIPIIGKSEDLEDCINAVANSDGIDPKIVIVDNGADNELVNRIGKNPMVTSIIRNENNMGFGGGCNQGIDEAKTEYVVLLNSDAIVQPLTIRLLLEPLITNSNVGIAAASAAKDGIIQEVGRVIARDAHTYPLREGLPLDLVTQELDTFVPYASFVCVALRKQDYEEVGRFDNDYYPAYSEDVDLCIRYWQKGKKVLVVPEAIVDHALNGSSSSVPEIEKIKERNRQLLLEKHSDFFSKLPLLNEPGKYPHEFKHAKNCIYKNNILLIVDKKISANDIAKYSESASSESLNFLTVIYSDKKSLMSNNELLAQASIEIYSPEEIELHHWLRERICLYDKVVVMADINKSLSSELLYAVLFSQPLADWEYILNEN